MAVTFKKGLQTEFGSCSMYIETISRYQTQNGDFLKVVLSKSSQI